MKYYQQTAPRRLAITIVAVFSFWLGMTSLHVWQLQQQQIAELEAVRAELACLQGEKIWCNW